MDETLLLMINPGWSHPALDLLFTWVSERWTFSIPLLLILLWDAVRRAGRQGLRLWLLLVVSIGIGDAVGNTLKSWIAEPRPCYSHHALLVEAGGRPMDRCEGARATGMPSNHALNFFLTATFMATASTWRGWQVGLVVAAVLVALSRVYLGKHLPSQVAAGAAIGMALGILAALWACYHRACIPGAPGERLFRDESDAWRK